jgi:hypothetical protein
VDETPVKGLDPEVKGQAATGFLWFYSHPRGDVFLEFCDRRGRENPKQRLQRFKGTIQTDAYAIYDSLRRERSATLRRLGGLSHARRRFYTAAEELCAHAIWFIAQIRQLYLMEDEVREVRDAERKTVRRAKAPPGWRSAVVYTIIQSCRRRGINPQEYLTDVLRRLPAMKNHEVKDLPPSRWQPGPVAPP